MKHSSIALAYDELADRWRDDQFSRTDGVHQHNRALGFLAEGTSGWALNVGCGCNTRFNSIMREHGLEIEGVDISERMVALARAADPAVTVHHADVCGWQPRRTYRFISARDSLWHIPLEQQRSVMIKLMSALVPGGVFIFSAGGLDEAQEHVDSAMWPRVYYSTLGIPGLLDVIRDTDCVCRHLELDQRPQNHLFIIVQRAP
ncbi:Methyltransferase domain-containing protein [Noviherbaspirillum humi]|uniref:Methyltransferase domain-containing protein n=1 Tax=Noviherbaspirillum humi TaxID=1688639 RepID=A0A239M5A7_9BURK|nr:class I SAM-dependent methyltransferase [Noviherbaspirillum humi]SNT37358.1 Methyltransferase domain-containing protein [Noviherbaspirillum humi]